MGAISHRPHARARQHQTLENPPGQIPSQQMVSCNSTELLMQEVNEAPQQKLRLVNTCFCNVRQKCKCAYKLLPQYSALHADTRQLTILVLAIGLHGCCLTCRIGKCTNATSYRLCKWLSANHPLGTGSTNTQHIDYTFIYMKRSKPYYKLSRQK